MFLLFILGNGMNITLLHTVIESISNKVTGISIYNRYIRRIKVEKSCFYLLFVEFSNINYKRQSYSNIKYTR